MFPCRAKDAAQCNMDPVELTSFDQVLGKSKDPKGCHVFRVERLDTHQTVAAKEFRNGQDEVSCSPHQLSW